MPMYTQSDPAVIAAAATTHLPPLVKFLGDKKFLAGDDVTVVDFFLWELLQAVRLAVPDLYTQFPSLQGYHDNFRALPGVKEYFDDEACHEHQLPFNNKMAQINGTTKN